MPLTHHLNELRHRLIVTVGASVVGMGLGFLWSIPAMARLQALAPAGVTFVQLSPGELLISSFKITVLLGIMLASPVILYQCLRFTLPGLTVREKRFVVLSVLSGSVLFVAGVLFAYLAVIPPALAFLMDYGRSLAVVQMSIAHFMDFCVALLAVTGVMFELPMVLFLLSFTGLVHSRQLIAHWRGVLVGIVLVSAIITPSQDPLTLLLVAGAMAFLYAASVVPIRLLGR